MTGEELRARLLAVRTEYTRMNAVIEAEVNLDFVDQLIHESEEYILSEVINMFPELDEMPNEEDIDWGQVNRDNLAAELQSAFDDAPRGKGWAAAADAAIRLLIEDPAAGDYFD